jgi:NAD(P)-dependent dehydrogenase (short-subunit alcohol dehydrogenase family)
VSSRSRSIQTVLITGAGRGLGLEFARQYSAAGWRVFACARTPAKSEALAELAKDSARKITVYALDVSDHAAIDDLARGLTGTPIDVLLNVAGLQSLSGFGKANYPAWTEVFRVNTLAPMKLAEAFVEQLAASDQKKIVTLSSILGSIAENDSGGMYGYRSTKAAVNAVMRTLSIDLAARGIIAVPMHPGWVRTDMGGPRAPIDAQTSVAGMIRVIAGLTSAQTGKFLSYTGEALPW